MDCYTTNRIFWESHVLESNWPYEPWRIAFFGAGRGMDPEEWTDGSNRIPRHFASGAHAPAAAPPRPKPRRGLRGSLRKTAEQGSKRKRNQFWGTHLKTPPKKKLGAFFGTFINRPKKSMGIKFCTGRSTPKELGLDGWAGWPAGWHIDW